MSTREAEGAFAESIRAAAAITTVYSDAPVRGNLTAAARPIAVSIKAVAYCLPGATVTLAVSATVHRRWIQTWIGCPAAVCRLKTSASNSLIRRERHQHGRARGYKADLRLVRQMPGDFGKRNAMAFPRSDSVVVNTVKQRHKVVVCFSV